MEKIYCRNFEEKTSLGEIGIVFYKDKLGNKELFRIIKAQFILLLLPLLFFANELGMAAILLVMLLVRGEKVDIEGFEAEVAKYFNIDKLFWNIVKLAIITLVVVFIIGIVTNKGYFTIVLLLLMGLGLLFLYSHYKAVSTKVFTDEGKKFYNRIIGMKNYIEDYSLLDEKEVLDVTLWEKYLTYAMVLNISTKAIDSIELREDKISSNAVNIEFDEHDKEIIQLIENLEKNKY